MSTIQTRTDFWEQATFYLALILLLLLLCTFAIEFQHFTSNSIVANIHYFSMVGSVLLLYSSFYLSFLGGSLTFNVVDVLLVVLGLYLVLNHLVKELYFTEYISSFVLAIYCIVGIRRLIRAGYGYRLRNVHLLAIPLLGIYEAAYGQLQILGYLKSNHGLFAITGSFHNPGPYAIYLSGILVFSMTIWLLPLQIPSSAGLRTEVQRFIKVICGFSCALIVMVLPATQSRTAWVSGSAGILFILVIKYGKALRAKWRGYPDSIKLSAGVTATIAVIISLLLLYNFKPDSVEGRWVVWKITWEAVQKNPLFGIGFDQFRFQYGNFQSEYFQSHFGSNLPDFNSEYVTYVFNDYLQLLVENGLVGLGLFLALIYVCFRRLPEAIKTNDAIVIGSYGGMLAILVAACSSYPLELIPIWFLFLLFVGFTARPTPECWSFRIPKNGYTKVALGLVLILCTFVFVKEVDLWRGRILWGKARQLYSEGRYSESSQVYKTAIVKLGNRPDILPDYGKALFMSEEYTESVHVLKMASEQVFDPIVFANLGDSYSALKNFKLAEQAYTNAIKITPDRMYPRYLLAKMYLNKGDTLAAKSAAQYILDMPVQVPSSATRDMLEKMEKVAKL